MTVRELLSRMSSKEISEWMAFESIEGFGTPRDDLRMGILASLIANVNRDRKRKPDPYTPEDFMPRLPEGE